MHDRRGEESGGRRGEWRRVEKSGGSRGEWRRVEGSGGEWRRVGIK